MPPPSPPPTLPLDSPRARPGPSSPEGRGRRLAPTSPTKGRHMRRTVAMLALMVTLTAGVTAAEARPPTTSEATGISDCESGGNYSAVNASSGAGGRWQFLQSTWRSTIDRYRPDLAEWRHVEAEHSPPWVQDALFVALFTHEGGGHWWPYEPAHCHRPAGGGPFIPHPEPAVYTPAAYAELHYGRRGDTVLLCDFTGDGLDELVAIRGNEWLRDSARDGHHHEEAFGYGRRGDEWACSDVNGDGLDDPIAIRDGVRFVRFTPTTGTADLTS